MVDMHSNFGFPPWIPGLYHLSGVQPLRARRGRLLGGGPMGVLRRKRGGEGKKGECRERERERERGAIRFPVRRWGEKENGYGSKQERKCYLQAGIIFVYNIMIKHSLAGEETWMGLNFPCSFTLSSICTEILKGRKKSIKGNLKKTIKKAHLETGSHCRRR